MEDGEESRRSSIAVRINPDEFEDKVKDLKNYDAFYNTFLESIKIWNEDKSKPII